MNAFGDATMALAFFVLMWQTGTLNFAESFIGADEPLPDRGQPRRARAARRRRGQVGPDPAPHVAPRRDGGPDAGLGADPRRDDGHGGRLPDRARAPDLRAGAVDLRPRRRARRDHAARRRPRRARPDGHQARDRVLDDVADRLHVRRRRARRLQQRDVPPDDARLLQGAALPRRRRDHPPPRRRAGHPQDGRPARLDAEDVHRLPDRLARPRRDPAARRLLLEGRDPRVGARERRLRPGSLLRRPDRGAADGPLHLPPLLPRLPRRAVAARPGARGGARPRRGPVDDDGAGRRPLRALGRRRLDRGRGRLAHVRRMARPDRDRARAPRPRRADDDAGLPHERARRRARRDRDLRRLAVLRRPPWAGAEVCRPSEHARAQVLVRRALRPDLLQAGRPAHPHPAARDRGAADRRLDLGGRGRHAKRRRAPSAVPRPATCAATPL